MTNATDADARKAAERVGLCAVKFDEIEPCLGYEIDMGGFMLVEAKLSPDGGHRCEAGAGFEMTPEAVVTYCETYNWFGDSELLWSTSE